MPDAILFEGIVTEEMYRSLLPKREAYLVLTLLCFLFALLLLILVVGIAAILTSRFEAPEVFAMLGLIFGILLTALYIMRRMSTKARVQAYLQKYPDLLGPTKGNFTSNGLIMDDQENLHWLSWARLSQMNIGKNGVRVALENDNPPRFVALGAELFCDGYRPNELARMQSRLQTSKTTYDDLHAGSARAFEMEVDSQSFFSGIFATPVKWTTWLQLLVSPISAACFLLIGFTQDRWPRLLILLTVISLIYTITSCFSLIRLIRQRNRNHHYCWGWLTEDHIIFGSELHAIRTPISALKCSDFNQEILQLQFASQASFFIFRPHFKDTDYFDAIRSKLLS